MENSKGQLEMTHRAFLASFSNKLGTSRKQVDSLRKCYFYWIFTEEFTHSI